jgi:hypothetical protein
LCVYVGGCVCVPNREWIRIEKDIDFCSNLFVTQEN